jgi:hypothetical protein
MIDVLLLVCMLGTVANLLCYFMCFSLIWEWWEGDGVSLFLSVPLLLVNFILTSVIIAAVHTYLTFPFHGVYL